MFGKFQGEGRSRWLTVAALGSAALLTLTACGDNSSDASAKGGNGETKSLKIVSLITATTPFPASVLTGVKAAAASAGDVDLQNVNTNFDTAEEATAVQNLIAQKPDGVILMANDGAAAATLVSKLHDADIPVLAVHTQVGTGTFEEPDPNLMAFVTQSEYDAGKQAGTLAANAVPDGGDIGIVEGSGCCFEAVKDRTEGFLEGVKDAGGSFKVVSKQPGAWVPEEAEKACQNMLQASPGIVLFYAQSDDMAAGCASAVKKAKSTAKVIGIGGSKLGIDGVKDGSVFGTVCYKPEDMGNLAAKTIIDTLRGGETKADPTFITYTTPAITADNVDDCTPQW
jgi:ABC-type sugar transport system substrate-binding protein